MIRSLPAAGALALAVILAVPVRLGAETVVLQQGADGYSGCKTRTVTPGAGKVVKDEKPGQFSLRGSANHLFCRFDIPRAHANKRLARARLMIFLPAARKPNAYTEIFCHEVVSGGRDTTIDEVTDYANGRRIGAVDSVELFSPVAGPGWAVHPYLPPAVPEGGKWIAFNVTALAEKWLRGGLNWGVLLAPTDRADHQYPSTWEIDVPAAAHADAKHRPKLVLEFAPLETPCLIGVTDSLRRICDRSTRYGFRGGYGTEYALSMAANEFEGFQAVLYPMLADLKDVRFTWTDLTAEGGKKIPAADVECFRVDTYKLRRNWMTSPLMFGGKVYDVADPLPPAKPATIKRHVHTPFYFRVRTRPGTAAGNYAGTLTAHAGKTKLADLKLTVEVWPFKIPRMWNFHTMGQFIWGNCGRFHGKDWNDKLQRKYYDFLLDHRFSPTEQYGRITSPRRDMAYCLKRGMNTIYLSGNFTGGKDETQALRASYEKVKRIGGLDHALVYIGDETSRWAKMQASADLVHAHLPGVLVMIGGSVPRPQLLNYIDVYDPIIGPNKVYGLDQEAVNLVRQSQARGEEFYWYVAAGPAYPYPNVQVEYPVVDSRVLFWMTFKYGVTGFEYYCYNIWSRNNAADPARRYPNVPWKADGWHGGWASNGDGMLFYPGPISSLRFEAIRDGIEDWEMLQVLADCVAAVAGRKRPAKYRGLVTAAKKYLAVPDEIVKGFKDFTRDPDLLLAHRQKVGELLAKFVPAVEALPEKWDAGQMSLAMAGQVRVGRQTALRRAMLRNRHLAACKRLKVDPLSEDAWNALWPKRVLFRQDFEGPATKEAYDWDGQIVTDNVPTGSKRALAGSAENKWFGRATRTGIYYDNARAATTTWVKFKYFVNKAGPLTVFVFDLTQADNWQCRIEKPVVGKWTEVTLNVTADFRKKGGGAAKVRAGDGLDDVFVFAGKPGDKDLKLIVDDVELIGRD